MSTIKANMVQIGQSATAAQNFTLYQPASPDGTVRLGNGNAGAATDRITVNASGDVGIGITAPVAKLQVVGGQVLLDNAQFYAIKTSTGVSNSVLTLNGTNNLLIGAGGATATAQIWTGGAERLRVDASGNVVSGVTNTQTLGTSGNVWSNVYATTFTGTNFTGTTFTGTSFNSITGLSSATPLAPGIAAVGVANTVARADHVHSGTITPERETANSLSTGAINLATGNYFHTVLTAPVTFSLTNVPTTGTAQSFILEITAGGTYAVTWFAGVKWASGVAPVLSVSPGRDVLSFFTRDGGTTWNGFLVGKNML